MKNSLATYENEETDRNKEEKTKEEQLNFNKGKKEIFIDEETSNNKKGKKKYKKVGEEPEAVVKGVSLFEKIE